MTIYASVLDKKQNYELELQINDEILKLNPYDWTALNCKAAVLRNLERYEDMHEVLASFLELSKTGKPKPERRDFAIVYNALSIYHRHQAQKPDPALAKEFALKAIHADPHYGAGFSTLAHYYQDQAKVKDKKRNEDLARYYFGLAYKADRRRFEENHPFEFKQINNVVNGGKSIDAFIADYSADLPADAITVEILVGKKAISAASE